MPHVNVVHEETRRGSQNPGAGITSGCELPCVCWAQISGPLGEQQAVLTTEPSLQPHLALFFPSLGNELIVFFNIDVILDMKKYRTV